MRDANLAGNLGRLNLHSYLLNRTIRQFRLTGRLRSGCADPIPLVIRLPVDDVPPWLSLEEIERTSEEAARQALVKLANRRVTPGQLLARKNVSADLRSKAARSMFAMRGGRAAAAKMRQCGFPNLVKAREALQRKRRNNAE